MDKDNQLVVLVDPQGAGKQLVTLADCCFHAAQVLGITSINLVEHTLKQKTVSGQQCDGPQLTQRSHNVLPY